MRRPDPYTAIEHMQGVEAVLPEWESRLGSSFDSFLPFLLPGVARPLFYPCPECGTSMRIAEYPDGGNIALHDDVHFCNNLQLSESDLLTYSLNTGGWLEKLCQLFSIEHAVSQHSNSIWRMGSIRLGAKRHPAYYLTEAGGQYIPAALQVDSLAGLPAIFFTPRYCPDTAEWLQQKQHGYFPLVDLFDIEAMLPTSNFHQSLQEYAAKMPEPVYRPHPDIQILDDFKRIRFPGGTCIELSRAHKRRAVVRFIYEWCRQSGNAEFDVEVVREEYNIQHSDKPWNSDRIREDLFKRNQDDFDCIFEEVDAPNGRYRLKI